MKRWMVWLIIGVLLTGCDQTKVVDDIDLVQVAAYDLEEDNLKGTFAISTYTKEGEGQPEIYTASGKTSKQILALASEKSSKPLELGQLRVIVFDKDLAKKGLKEILDTMNRMPNVGNLIYLAISNGKAETILRGSYTKEKGISNYLPSLIEQNITYGILPETNLYLFLNQLYDDARDSYLPIVSNKGNILKIDGIALFKGYTMVDSITAKDLFIFKVLTDKFYRGTYQFKLPGTPDNYAVIENIKAKTKYKMKGNSKYPFIDARIQVKGKIQEFTERKNLENPKEVQKLESVMEEELERQAAKLIERFIAKGTDPLGLRKFGRVHTRKWNDKEWAESYKHLRFQVTADVKIIQSGVTE
ncbi:Ger(x)C family spore germination protein [Mesobacillus zeae]|uniref:Ger(X)C family spore germination protein n=1 Tax=Mesobacillus zeae TaxID=1917180 RepID=A0A398BEY7_9BACI|nr:Ger(x)C family spore germination protein [Mesobacillus zeae]RID88815.1 Ger(x)C family spore germination protein [Mesobacillus zeae]